MIEWTETHAILRRADGLAAEGLTSAIATVVGIQGSAYRRPGARFLVEPSGATMGSVSGGCLEADVREVAAAVIAGGPARLLHYDTGVGEGESRGDQMPWGLGLGCEGAVDVFVEALPPDDPTGCRATLLQLLDGDEPFVLTTVVSHPEGAGATRLWPRALLEGAVGQEVGEEDSRQSGVPRQARELARRRLAERTSGLEPIGDALVFVQAFLPPPEILICGAGDDAIPLARYAAEAGLRVTLLDHRTGFLEPARFPAARRLEHRRPTEGLGDIAPGESTFAVVMSHSLEIDRGWLRSLLPTAVPYIGLLGPKERARELLSETPESSRLRVFGPIGLDLGAEGPAQVAMSILAEILAVHAARDPRSLREREASIHATQGPGS